MKELGNLKDTTKNIEKNIEKKLELGAAYEKNKEEYQKLHDEIYNSDIPDEEKNRLITKIGEYNYALQVAFEENVEKPIEEQEEKREKAIEKSQEHIEELNRTIENMEDFSRKAKADKSAIEGGVKEAQKMANIYEDFKRQKLMDQKLTMERLQKQRNKIMRDSF